MTSIASVAHLPPRTSHPPIRSNAAFKLDLESWALGKTAADNRIQLLSSKTAVTFRGHRAANSRRTDFIENLIFKQ